MKKTGKALGIWGEDKAEAYLTKNGVEIIARNVRTEYGEIDIIGHVENTLLFVEVKTSRTHKFGYPEVSVNAKKMAHMTKSALKYTQDHVELTANWRIDVISVEVMPDDEAELMWFKNVSNA